MLDSRLDFARKACSRLKKVRLVLLDPTADALDISAAEMETAAECLRQLQASLEARSGPSGEEAELELEMANMRQELKQVSVLVEGAGKFYRGWARLGDIIDDAPANYTARGKSDGMLTRQPRRLALNG